MHDKQDGVAAFMVFISAQIMVHSNVTNDCDHSGIAEPRWSFPTSAAYNYFSIKDCSPGKVVSRWPFLTNAPNHISIKSDGHDNVSRKMGEQSFLARTRITLLHGIANQDDSNQDDNRQRRSTDFDSACASRVPTVLLALLCRV